MEKDSENQPNPLHPFIAELEERLQGRKGIVIYEQDISNRDSNGTMENPIRLETSLYTFEEISERKLISLKGIKKQ